ncbi:MAG: hypothetical protein M1830_000836 [Pleopsidium flavum]|nr:MAG: hypothetical protein M1830_000836 [Pleopsidium flavum]
MARLHDDSDDDLPELSTVLAQYTRTDPQRSSATITVAAIQEQGQNIESKSSGDGGNPYLSQPGAGHCSQPCEQSVWHATHDERHMQRLRPLGVAYVNSVLLSIPSATPKMSRTSACLHPTDKTLASVRATPRRMAGLAVDDGDRVLGQNSSLNLLSDDLFDSMSESTVKRVSDEDHCHRPQVLREWAEEQNSVPKMAAARSTLINPGAPFSTSAGRISSPRASSLELMLAVKALDVDKSVKLHAAANLVHTNVFHSEPSATLKYSPPRTRSPSKCTDRVYFTTPPPSPSKSRLQSPKKQQRIPASPHRPSIDAFWSQDIINEWNDEYSPRKAPRSGRPALGHSVTEDDDEELSPLTFPRRSIVKSPVRKDRKALGARRAFDEKKHELAQEFLKELDDVVAKGKVASLAASGGGIRLIWSKKLNSTAGRANWRQEVIRSKGNGDISSTSYQHHASIELAEKVINNEAHEYCHLANFMISGVKNNPHGKEFKEWAKRCSQAFRHRGIEVTTKHSFNIDYKYTWECTECGIEFKRHSKSIDPARHTCGSCKSRLMQTEPAPRTAPPSEYQLYVKLHFQQLKKANPKSSQKELMSLLGKAYREYKAMCLAPSVKTAVELIDVEENKGEFIKEDLCDNTEIDSVSRTLDFLNLMSG